MQGGLKNMKIIYDDLYYDEFFRMGGRVHVGVFGFDVDTAGKFEQTIRAQAWKDEYLDPKNGGDAWIGDQHFTYSNKVFNYRGEIPTLPINDPYGVPNTNFSLIDPQDSRWEDFKELRIKNGFDPSEIWALDTAILKFMLPRIEWLRDHFCGYPAYLTEEKWKETLDKICNAIKLALDDRYDGVIDGPKIIKRLYEKKEPEKCKELLEKNKEYREGMKLLIKHFYQLGD